MASVITKKVSCFPQILNIIIILVLSLTKHGECVRFEVESGHTKCISEEIKTDAMSVGKYSVINPNQNHNHSLPDSHKLNVRVISPNGNKYNYHTADQVGEGKFAFHTVEAGDYITCFTAVDHKPATTITVEFEWKSGVATKDWTNVVKKGSVDAMQMELAKMFESVENIQSEMLYLRGREEEMQLLNIATNMKMTWMSFGSILICLTVAGMQFWHLKSFFEKKKII